jgi:hypothetical protein
MVKVMPREIEQQLTGLSRAVVHAEKLFQRGVITHDELEHVRTFALEQRFGPLMDTKTYVKARENGDFEAYEALLSDPRSGTAAQREMAMRKAAASYVAEQALEYQPKSQEEQNAVMAQARKRMSEFVDMSDEDADNDFAVYQKHAKLTLGDEVRKPVEVPSWAKPVQRISDEDAAARDFTLRMEGTKGSRAWNDSHDAMGVKRAPAMNTFSKLDFQRSVRQRSYRVRLRPCRRIRAPRHMRAHPVFRSPAPPEGIKLLPILQRPPRPRWDVPAYRLRGRVRAERT